ncbi:MAG: nucleotidyltransferase domain-containing protein [Rhodocyclaceae bacterium]|nr:nucleotidyltransferase domain-containing protein [Rhodocyclaceae bacterium]
MLAEQRASAWGLKPAVVEQMGKVFRGHPGILRVILYGSRAKGTFQPGSDIDLTVEGDLSLAELLHLEGELDDLLLPYQIDLSLLRQIDDRAVLDHIGRVGQVFFSSQNPES